MDIEEDDFWSRRAGGSKRGFPVSGFPDDLETIHFQQRPCRRTEAGMVIDDEQPDRHTVIVSRPSGESYTASRTLFRAEPRSARNSNQAGLRPPFPSRQWRTHWRTSLNVPANGHIHSGLETVVSSKARLEELRDSYRFALAYWALHRLRESRDNAWGDVLKTFVPWLGSVEKMTRQTDQVVQIDLDTRLFLQWHETPVQMGWAAPRAFLVFVLLQHAPDQIPADIGVPRFLQGTMSTEIEQMLDAVATDQELWQLLLGPPADLDERVEALRRAIRASGTAARADLGLQ